MQAVELILIAAAALTAAAYLLVRHQRNQGTDAHVPRILIGVVPGLIGGALAAVTGLDFVPDDIEGPIWATLFVAISGIAIIGTSYRLVRR